jgi:hypothetical protein
VTVMDERKIKVYGFVGTLEFIGQNYDDAGRKRIFSALSPEVHGFMEVAKKAQWAPVLHSSALWAGIVREHADPVQAQAQLVRTGRHMGSYATNTYLKLLMKMMSMKMFAKKYPDIWARDANFAKLSCDITDIDSGRLLLNFKELGTYPYFGPVCQGWFAFAFETMGLKNVKVDLMNWSMQNPDPGELTFNVTWTK